MTNVTLEIIDRSSFPFSMSPDLPAYKVCVFTSDHCSKLILIADIPTRNHQR